MGAAFGSERERVPVQWPEDVDELREGPRLVCATKSVVGEGVLWDARRQRLVWVDIEGRCLYEWHYGKPSAEVTRTPERVGCVALREDGSLLLAAEKGFAHFDFGSGWGRPVPSPYRQPEGDRSIRLNDGKVDREGRLVCGGWNGRHCETPLWEKRVGVFRVGGEEGGERLLDELVKCANAICFSRDGETMYFTDSPERRILAFDNYAAAEAPIAKASARVVADLDALGIAEGVFDGACVDSEDCLWVCVCSGGCVLRIDPASGSLLQRVDMPVRRPTCPALGGPNLDILFVTSIGPPIAKDEELRATPDAGGLFAFKVSVCGIPEPFLAF